MTEKNTNEITAKILAIGSMIDGLDIGLERARELREKLLLSGQYENMGLDILIEILGKDKSELKDAMKELQKRL